MGLVLLQQSERIRWWSRFSQLIRQSCNIFSQGVAGRALAVMAKQHGSNNLSCDRFDTDMKAPKRPSQSGVASQDRTSLAHCLWTAKPKQ